MTHSIEISIDHDDPRQAEKHHREQEPCSAEIELDLQYEESDAAWGADADGSGYFEWCGEIPDKCSECGHVYTEEEKEELAKQATQKASDYEYELPEPDYD